RCDRSPPTPGRCRPRAGACPAAEGTQCLRRTASPPATPQHDVARGPREHRRPARPRALLRHRARRTLLARRLRAELAESFDDAGLYERPAQDAEVLVHGREGAPLRGDVPRLALKGLGVAVESLAVPGQGLVDALLPDEARGPAHLPVTEHVEQRD